MFQENFEYNRDLRNILKTIKYFPTLNRINSYTHVQLLPQKTVHIPNSINKDV